MSDVGTSGSTGSSGDAARVIVGLSMEPGPQRRGTVLIRWILALPVALVGVFIYLAAFFWVIGAWISALATGRVPDTLQQRLCGVLRFQARLSAYVNLLTDVWPGVHFAARPGEPVALDVDHVDLRRSAVLFRLILVIPAAVLASAVSTGLYPFLVVMWVATLVTGRAPRPLHQLAALSMRMTLRTAAYWLLVTPTQPFEGFFGDPAPEGLSAPDTAAPALSTSWPVDLNVKVLLVVAVVLGLASSSTSHSWSHQYGSGGVAPHTAPTALAPSVHPRASG